MGKLYPMDTWGPRVFAISRERGIGGIGLVELEKVAKSFAGRQVLEPIDLVLPTGRTSALLGPSGCGKSTLLRLMIGLLTPDSGSVRVAGTPLGEQNLAALRRRMGYVIQDGGLFPHLSARDNVTLAARTMPKGERWPKGRIEDRLAELSRLTHFPKDGLSRFPAQLSGGQQQRVALMRALFLDPEVLLLDEPLGALDPLIRSDLQHDLREIFQSLGKTVVLVTHDISEAGFLADQIILLRAGRVIQNGTLEEFVRTPADPFVSRFINAQRSPLESLGATHA